MGSAAKARVLVVGTGGVGTMAAYALETGGKAEVTAVLRSNFDAVQASGFIIDSIDHGQGIKAFRPTEISKTVPDVAKEGLPSFEYIIVTTKNVPDVKPNVLDIIEPAVTPGETAIVLLQNGLNIEKMITERFPDNVVLSGVSLIGATETSKGCIRHDDNDVSKVGPFADQKVSAERAKAEGERFVEIYGACGKVDCKYDDNVHFTRWRKLVYNASFNSVSAILGMDVIRMRMSQHIIDDLVRPAMLEVKAVAKAAGYELPDGVDDFFITVDTPEAFFKPSMGQDMAKGNFMEMEVIVGEPVREAQRLGVAVPTLTTIYGLLKGLQLMTKEAKGMWEPHFEKGNPYC